MQDFQNVIRMILDAERLLDDFGSVEAAHDQPLQDGAEDPDHDEGRDHRGGGSRCHSCCCQQQQREEHNVSSIRNNETIHRGDKVAVANVKQVCVIMELRRRKLGPSRDTTESCRESESSSLASLDVIVVFDARGR